MFYVHFCTISVLFLQRPRKGIGSHRTGVIDSCWLPCEGLKSKRGSSGRTTSIRDFWVISTDLECSNFYCECAYVLTHVLVHACTLCVYVKPEDNMRYQFFHVPFPLFIEIVSLTGWNLSAWTSLWALGIALPLLTQCWDYNIVTIFFKCGFSVLNLSLVTLYLAPSESKNSIQ